MAAAGSNNTVASCYMPQDEPLDISFMHRISAISDEKELLFMPFKMVEKREIIILASALFSLRKHFSGNYLYGYFLYGNNRFKINKIP